ncbi:aromatic ring-hydroxylating dioxygenase subunit alpha [Zavarzinia compransoris]|uniref:aromatic ring-hydroxylating oxygenase subunit alpha n=1 Tax=Zavarzinia marina TaxID=2911065 RepID=UPI001F19FAC3|nr:aromatic ring-hydroxylating dioxygenase subunit alpha [Zavarzinia marina]MCF4166274.1 aromatic ring-hydroxylating dioxygenase subunit alpha [Zavarzinia marina]
MTAPLAPELEAIRREVIATAARPLERATTLPAAAYTSEAWFDFERRAIFEAEWMCLAHVSQVPEPGSYLALDLFDEPLLVTRDKAGAIHVLSRVCAHRAMDIMPPDGDLPPSGKRSSLVCPYHAWVYNLDGSLRGCVQMQNAEGFEKADYPLQSFRSEVWQGFIFVNFDEKAEPLAVQYADLAEAVAPWDMATMELAIEMTWDCAFNWKVMIENWMESYHHIGAHARTLNPSMPGENTWTEPEHPHFIKAHLPYTDALRAEMKAAADGGPKVPGFPPIAGLGDEQAHEWGLYVGFPCFMMLTTHDRVLWYRLFPDGAGRCRLLTTTLVRPEARQAPDWAEALESETEMLRAFHTEDMVVNAAVQRGLHSRKVVRGRLSHLEEPVWLIHRYVAAMAEGRHPARARRAPYYGPRARPAESVSQAASSV